VAEQTNYAGRRVNRNTFFEPVYDPALIAKIKETDFQDGNWNFDNERGPCRYILKAESLKEGEKLFYKFEKVIFDECDFTGIFDFANIVFSNCAFIKCDFSGELHNVKFSNCKFEDTSLSLLKMYNCQLRECSYKRIGLSGNETQIFSTDITHPGRFLAASTTNLNHLPDGVKKEYQLLRLNNTRAKLARIILQNQATEGSDESYYDAVKAATLYGTMSRKANAKLLLPRFDTKEASKDRTFFSKISAHFLSWAISFSCSVEYSILWVAGNMNAWGSSIFRVIIIGAAIIITITALRACAINGTNLEAFLQSVEIFLIFGYTKHSTLEGQMLAQIFDIATAVLGLCWYAVSAATIVNKVTRVRG
jgi:uncharacterized protein YjbI with pentapeptide repeats